MTWWAPVLPVNPRPTPCCGSWAMTSRTCRISAAAACASAAKLRLSSLTPWKMRARCRLKLTFLTDMGDVIDVYHYQGEVRNHETGELLATLRTENRRADRRSACRWSSIPLIIGRGLTTKAREALGLPHSRRVLRQAKTWRKQPWLLSGAENGRSRLRHEGSIHPGAYCEPK